MSRALHAVELEWGSFVAVDNRISGAMAIAGPKSGPAKWPIQIKINGSKCSFTCNFEFSMKTYNLQNDFRGADMPSEQYSAAPVSKSHSKKTGHIMHKFNLASKQSFVPLTIIILNIIINIVLHYVILFRHHIINLICFLFLSTAVLKRLIREL